MFRAPRSLAIVLMSGSLAGCAQRPTPEECKAGIARMLNIQIDELDTPGSAASAAFADVSEADKRTQLDLLKTRSSSIITPAFVSLCVNRMKRTDMSCTMSARTSGELVKKCNWKQGTGGRGGTTLGF